LVDTQFHTFFGLSHFGIVRAKHPSILYSCPSAVPFPGDSGGSSLAHRHRRNAAAAARVLLSTTASLQAVAFTLKPSKTTAETLQKVTESESWSALGQLSRAEQENIPQVSLSCLKIFYYRSAFWQIKTFPK
jgi:hypothetical protein